MTAIGLPASATMRVAAEAYQRHSIIIESWEVEDIVEGRLFGTIGRFDHASIDKVRRLAREYGLEAR